MFDPNASRPKTLGIDRVKLRLAVFAILIVASFIALFSRLWYLQVLAVGDFRDLARENRVRRVEGEPIRGTILDRNGLKLVENRESVTVTVDPQVVDTPEEEKEVFRELAGLLDRPKKELLRRFHAETVSPYKAVAVANDVDEEDIWYIDENDEDLPGVDHELRPVRVYPQGRIAGQILGYVREISEAQLEIDYFTQAKRPYRPGDIVGQMGVERDYDRHLRGRPSIQRVVVNSLNEPISKPEDVAEASSGKDLITAIDARVQRLSENALEAGLMASRGAGYRATSGGVVVMDPMTGDVVAMASYPGLDPRKLADGISFKEYRKLGDNTPKDPDDDALLNRAIQVARPPGSTFKVVTAGAALVNGVIDIFTTLDCPGSAVYPPDNRPGAITFNNWTSINLGRIGLAKSLEVSCDTFYYELGWRMEELWGPIYGDGEERFPDYMRRAGFGRETGIDIPNETEGVVPDEAWCIQLHKDDKTSCVDGWQPGFSVNAAIGQGDVAVTPLQLAVTFAAIANGGSVMEPRIVTALGKSIDLDEQVVESFEPRTLRSLGLTAEQLAVIEQGLLDVVAGRDGTARGAFAGFPVDRYPIAGKTGTAEIGETDENIAWFISYGPVPNPEYVISVYLEKSGHGGDSAAPVAREIWEGIYELDDETNVQLGPTDQSG